jgi:uncharacterized repeat protein (TIGR04138 family)
MGANELLPRQLKLNVRCRCGYNLRGICVTRACPECGKSIEGVLKGVPLPILDQRREDRVNTVRLNLAPIAKKSNRPVDAFLFLLDAYDYTRNLTGTHDRLSAHDLCYGKQEYALAYFSGDVAEARAALKEWEMSWSEDIGGMVSALIEAGWMGRAEKDKLKDFVDVFTPDTLFAGDAS